MVRVIKRLVHNMRQVLTCAMLSLLAACAGTPKAPYTVESSEPQPAYTPASELDWRRLPSPDHTLANFRPGETPDYCFDRATQPYTAVVDSHFHPKPFGGPAMDAQHLW